MSNLLIYSNKLISDGSWKPNEGESYRCWHCLREFTHAPVPVPTYYDENKRRYNVTGTFHCFPCAKAYMCSRIGYCTPISMMWLTQMAKECFGYRKMRIEAAPDQEWLLSNMITEEDFDKICGSNEPCETLRNTLIPACILESSSLVMVHGKPSVTLQDVLSTRNNESEVRESHNHNVVNEESTVSQSSMYGKFLSQVSTENKVTELPQQNVRKQAKRAREEKTTTRKSGGSLASFIRK